MDGRCKRRYCCGWWSRTKEIVLDNCHILRGVVVDQLDTVYVADFGNARIMRWMKGATQGNIIVGGNGEGETIKPTQLALSVYHSIDMVISMSSISGNHRVQKFNID